MNRIELKFSELRKAHKKAFIVFITAGYPSLVVTERLILEFERIGVDIIELGVPFSDPLADGPIIQEASQTALKNNVYLPDILRLIKAVRKISNIPICLMTYYNPVFCFGEDKFAQAAYQSGLDGVIVPDLPPEEAQTLLKYSRLRGLDNIFLLAPTSTKERIKLISRTCQGFVYYVSLTGVTGPRARLPEDFTRRIKLIKRQTYKPVCVGFGVSHPQQVVEVYKIADGVIVGSAIVRKIKENIGKPDLVKRVSRFVKYLKG